MKKLKISWEEYNQTVEKLAKIIRDSNYPFNMIVALARGGLRPGDVLSRIFKVPMAILSVESYRGDNIEDQRGHMVFSRDLALTVAGIRDKVLLVDDLADTGITLEKSLQWLKHYYGFYISEIKTATLWSKKDSKYKPDFCANPLKDSPWIVQPFEVYENIRPKDLK